MKKILGVIIISVVLALTACNENIAGINENITHENLSVKVTEVFGNNTTAYILLEASMGENESVSNGRLLDSVVDIDEKGSYSFNLIGRNENSHTQTYLIRVAAEEGLKGKDIYIALSNYVSEENPMNRLIDPKAKWEFSFKYNPKEAVTKSFDDEIVSRIDIYDDVLIIIPKDNQSLSTIENSCPVFNNGTEGKNVEYEICSSDEQRCYMSKIVYIFEESEMKKIKNVVIGENSYSLTE